MFKKMKSVLLIVLVLVMLFSTGCSPNNGKITDQYIPRLNYVREVNLTELREDPNNTKLLLDYFEIPKEMTVNIEDFRLSKSKSYLILPYLGSVSDEKFDIRIYFNDLEQLNSYKERGDLEGDTNKLLNVVFDKTLVTADKVLFYYNAVGFVEEIDASEKESIEALKLKMSRNIGMLDDANNVLCRENERLKAEIESLEERINVIKENEGVK